MNSSFARRIALFGLVCLASAAPAESQPARIEDNADLFHADAVARAEQRIDDIRQMFDRNVFVRTVASASPRQHRLFHFLSRREANRLLEEQARKYADESALPGIYVVICKQPADVHVIVRPKNDAAFSHHDAEELRRKLAQRRWDNRDSDPALLSLVEHVHTVLQEHATPGASHSLVNEFVLAGLLGGGLGLWVVLAGLRFRMRVRRAMKPSEQDAAMQARAAPALLGAMFGFPAGLWIYDKLYPCPSASPSPLCEPRSESPSRTVDVSLEGTDSEEYPQEQHVEDAPVSP